MGGDDRLHPLGRYLRQQRDQTQARRERQRCFGFVEQVQAGIDDPRLEHLQESLAVAPRMQVHASEAVGP